jgi:hypothetical protein
MPQAAAALAVAAAAATVEEDNSTPLAKPADFSCILTTPTHARSSNILFRPACVSDIPAAAAMFAAAFEQDPEIQFLYKGVKPHAFQAAVQALYSKCTRLFFCRKGCLSWCAVDAATQVRRQQQQQQQQQQEIQTSFFCHLVSSSPVWFDRFAGVVSVVCDNLTLHTPCQRSSGQVQSLTQLMVDIINHG